MKLFSNHQRTYKGPATASESDFEYLDRSARSKARKIRRVLQHWFNNYPDRSKIDLQGRFRSKNNQHHSGAFFELFMHELLNQLGCLVEVHPNTDNENKSTPDFYVKNREGLNFYLEATVATGMSQKQQAARARTSTVLDTLNKLESPDFFVSVIESGEPKTPPSGKKFAHF
jgi:hypothetical protein